MKNRILNISKSLFLLSLASSSLVNAQEEPKKNEWSVRLEAYKPKPLQAFVNATENGFHFPNNFGLCAGAERNWTKSEHWRTYQTAVFGFYNHVYFERVFTLETGYGVNYRIWKGITLGAEMNVGYNFARSSHLISTYETDRWVSKVDKSVVSNRFTTGLALNLQYDFGQHFEGKIPVALTLGYSAQFLTPFDKNIAPFFLYHQPRIGARWTLK
jgi:hypothetical protein